MGFNDEKRWVLDCLSDGKVVHEFRGLDSDKNWLADGRLTLAQVISLVKACPGKQAKCSPHHSRPELLIWVLEPVAAGVRWYLKFHRAPGDRVKFLPVHPG